MPLIVQSSWSAAVQLAHRARAGALGGAASGKRAARACGKHGGSAPVRERNHVRSRRAVVPDIRVALEMRRFEAIPGQEVIVEAHWWARAGTQQTASEGTGVARLPVRGRPDDYESLVAAEAAALAAIGADVAGVIQRETAD